MVRAGLVKLGLASAVMSMCLGGFARGIAADGDRIAIDETNFPDPIFRAVVSTYDTDSDGFFSEDEISGVTTLTVFELGVTSLKGVEYFRSLEELNCARNQLTSLDMSKNEKLKMLLCHENPLTDLDVSKNTELYFLGCGYTRLTTLDVSQNLSLEILFVDEDPLTSLDVSKNLLLTTLQCSNTNLNPDLSNNTLLGTLVCRNNHLTNLNVSDKPVLRSLSCSGNNLTSLDVSNNPDLYDLECFDNHLTSLDVSKNRELEVLLCQNNKIKELNVDFHRRLKYLYCDNNQLTSLNVKKSAELFELKCENNQISDLDVTRQTKLKRLYCGNNKIQSLDLSANLALEQVFCQNNQLTELDISRLPALVFLACDENQLTNLVLNECLQDLNCSNNQLTNLDLSKNTALKSLQCSSNKLVGLDVSGMSGLNYCFCDDNQLARLDVSKNFELKGLDCAKNQLTELNVDNNAELDYVLCQDNQIRNLDISNCQKILERINDFGVYLTDEGKHYICESGHVYLYVDSYVKTNPKLFDPKPTPTSTPTPKPTVTIKPTVTPTPKPTVTTKPTVTPTPIVRAPSFEDFVERLYTIALNRASDPKGKEFWVKQVVDEGKTGADCARFFLLSPEFMDRNLSVEDFVETLYATFFDRESDAEGKNGWVGAIQSGQKSRADVVENFIESTEWCNVCATYGVKSGSKYYRATKASKNAINFATRLYTCCLAREPEKNGLEYWSLALTNLQKNGSEAAQFFFESEEFIGFKTSDKEYLTRLYTTFMDREPEESGLGFWLNEMKNGESRHNVLAWFAQSPEFTEICHKYGIDRGEI